jgi:putative oxidoreductase
MFPNRLWTLGRCAESFELADLILSWTGDDPNPQKLRAEKERFPVLRILLATQHSPAIAVLRLVLGLVFFAYGVEKTVGWFEGFGLAGTMSFPTGAPHSPTAITVIATAAEFFGGLGLIVGFLTRVIAAGVALDMVVAILAVDSKYGFFIGELGTQNGVGFEFHLLALAIALFLMMQGSGAASFDGLLFPSARRSYQEILDLTKTVAVGKIRLVRRLS